MQASFQRRLLYTKKVEIDISTHFLLSLGFPSSPRGERGIRTPGASQLNGFQDRRNRPLCHLSSSECACRMNDACQRPWATAIPPLKSKITFDLVLLVLGAKKFLIPKSECKSTAFF